MPKFANAHLVLNSRDRTLAGSNGVYNNFNLGNPGQNMVQGAMKDIALSEVLFPYDIPNVQAGYNTFTLVNIGTPDIEFSVTVAPGFYTGSELASAVNAAIVAAGAAQAPPIVATDLPSVAYTAISNIFVFAAPLAGGVSAPRFRVWNILSPFLNPGNLPVTQYTNIGKDLLSIMGFNRDGSFQVISTPGSEADFFSGSAPLVFTQYIDICSPKLCQYQFIRDGSTTSLPRRVDLICRLYVADEISLPTGGGGLVGSRPFVMHRQFKNQRVMRNTAANAINDVDIQLYDDCGQPLLTTWQPRDFQITFHVYEAGDRETENNIGYRY